MKRTRAIALTLSALAAAGCVSEDVAPICPEPAEPVCPGSVDAGTVEALDGGADAGSEDAAVDTPRIDSVNRRRCLERYSAPEGGFNLIETVPRPGDGRVEETWQLNGKLEAGCALYFVDFRLRFWRWEGEPRDIVNAVRVTTCNQCESTRMLRFYMRYAPSIERQFGGPLDIFRPMPVTYRLFNQRQFLPEAHYLRTDFPGRLLRYIHPVAPGGAVAGLWETSSDLSFGELRDLRKLTYRHEREPPAIEPFDYLSGPLELAVAVPELLRLGAEEPTNGYTQLTDWLLEAGYNPRLREYTFPAKLAGFDAVPLREVRMPVASWPPGLLEFLHADARKSE